MKTNPGARINEADTILVDSNQQHFWELWFSLLLQASKNDEACIMYMHDMG